MLSGSHTQSSPSGPAATLEAHAAPAERALLARRILLEALFLGGLGDSLLRAGPGIGLFLWTVAFAITVVRLIHRHGEGFRREQLGWMVTMLVFAGFFGWRDSGGLLFYDFVAAVGAGLFLAATLGAGSPIRSILGQRVRDLVGAVAFAVRTSITGVVGPVRESAIGVRSSWYEGRARAGLRALILTIPLLLIFGLLFANADPVFGSLLSLPDLQLDVIASHVFIAAFVMWATAGWLHGAFASVARAATPERQPALSLGIIDVTAILGGLVALFGAFVAVQVGWLFGGERLVRSTTGLGYAEYARHGFFELVWVSLLVLPVLLGTRALIRDGDTAAIRRHRLLAVPLLVLLGGVMTSALGRMALYVHYYGPSTARLYASVFMCWLAIVFVWFGLTILRGRTRDFAAGMTITGFLTLAGLNLVNPEALVARASVQRASAALAVTDSIAATSKASSTAGPSSPIDYFYLTWSLDGDAASEVVRALLAPPVTQPSTAAREVEVRSRCDAVRQLLERWGPTARATDWRRWNVGAWRAHKAVRSQEAALRAVTCWDAGGELPFGTREQRDPVKGEQWYHERT
ncbi:MAG TPA: DUF4173 domain-containing protein [Gemmatimonadaceae bacterium]|nr:DUF4173 domain-containing protein [Gemmatimonadaceae bacterium]